MTSTRWDTATGEVVIRCDARTAHELLVFLKNEGALPCKELDKLRDALEHTMRIVP